jgi:hypothetical protein
LFAHDQRAGRRRNDLAARARTIAAQAACHPVQQEMTETAEITIQDQESLRNAVRLLEHPSLAGRLTNIVGKPVELIGLALPCSHPSRSHPQRRRAQSRAAVDCRHRAQRGRRPARSGDRARRGACIYFWRPIPRGLVFLLVSAAIKDENKGKFKRLCFYAVVGQGHQPSLLRSFGLAGQFTAP